MIELLTAVVINIAAVVVLALIAATLILLGHVIDNRYD